LIVRKIKVKKSLFVDLGLLRRNRAFLHVFVARTISLLGLGMLSVALPLQVYQLSGDSVSVGLSMALEGAGMFAGLLLGGVLSDRLDRKRLILFARSACGLAFLGLAINAALPAPSLLATYLLAMWDGFFGAIGVTALLAAMPCIVGRENLMQARAISMVSMRLATVISPAVGGLLIAAYGVSWSYLIAAFSTGLTLLPLMSLPSMKPVEVDESHPLRALMDGVQYMLNNKVVFSVVMVGTLVTLTTAIRVMFPAMVQTIYGGGAFELGLMYTAVPLGATAGALLSGWASHVRQPGVVMQLAGLGAFACLILLSVPSHFASVLVLLVVFGYCISIASLLQYSLVQAYTPDAYLGRVNGLWTAQDAMGDSIGTLGISVVAKWLSPLGGILGVGLVSMVCGLVGLSCLRTLRHARGDGPDVTPADAADVAAVPIGTP
jgi:ENTS family enterobactin (siderophore) exporter